MYVFLMNLYLLYAAVLTCTCDHPSVRELAPLRVSCYSPPQVLPSRTNYYSIPAPRSLNSRDPQKSPSIFDSGTYGRNLIQRMDHRAAAETWNVPQVSAPLPVIAV